MSAKELTITEIEYDVPGPNTGHQWIEIQNTSSTTLNLKDSSLRIKDHSGLHLLQIMQGSNSILQPLEVSLFAQNPSVFLSDVPSYMGVLGKSSFSLTSAGSVAIVRNKSEILDTALYTSQSGAKGDGNTLQLSHGIFIPAAPTPGVVPSILPTAIQSTKLSSTGHSSKQRTKKAVKSTTSKRSKSTRTTKSSTKHAKGTTAATVTADAVTVAAPYMPILVLPLFLEPYKALLSTVWFGVFLCLLAFSGFSLIVLRSYDQRGYTT